MYIALVIIIICILIDQITKILARHYLKKNKKNIKIFKEFINLSYLENSGGAMGKFSGSLWILIISTLISLFIFFILMKYYDLNNNLLYSISLCILIGGTIGNFIDRIIMGYVTDFMYFKIKNKSTAVFNFADIFIFLSVLLIVVSIII